MRESSCVKTRARGTKSWTASSVGGRQPPRATREQESPYPRQGLTFAALRKRALKSRATVRPCLRTMPFRLMLVLSAHTSAPDDAEARPTACAWRFRPGTFAVRVRRADVRSFSSLACCHLWRATSANEPCSERSEQLLSGFAPVHCDSWLRPLLQSEELGRFQAGRPATPGLADCLHPL